MNILNLIILFLNVLMLKQFFLTFPFALGTEIFFLDIMICKNIKYVVIVF